MQTSLLIRFGIFLLKVTVLCLPFSFELRFFGDARIHFPTEILIGLLAVLFVIDLLRNSTVKKTYLLQEFLWVLPLLAAYVVFALFSGMPMVSAKFSIVNIVYILVFFVLLVRLLKSNPGLFSQLMLLYSLGVIAVAGWGLFQFWQYEWNPVVIPGIFRPFYRDHTILGASAAFLAVFWVSYSFLKGRKAITWIISFVLGFFFIFMVIFSGSRAAFISLFISLFTGALFLLRFRVRHILVMALSFLLTGLIFSDFIKDRFSSNLSESRTHYVDYSEHIRSSGNISNDVSNLERMNRWISAWRMFKNKPLTGYGPGTYQFAYIPFQEESLMTYLSVKDPYDIPEGSGGTAHSEYLLVLSEMGIFGLIAMLLFLGRLLFLAFEKSYRNPGKLEIIIAFTALSSYLFHALFNNFLATEKVAFLFWGMAAWLVANYYRDNEERELLPAS